MINEGVIRKKTSFGYTCGELKEYWFGSYFFTILFPVENTFCILVPMVAWITDYYCPYGRPDQALILDTISIQQFNFRSDPLWTEKGFFETCVIGLPRLVQFCGLHFAVTESQHKYQRKFGAKFLSWKCYDSVRFVGRAWISIQSHIAFVWSAICSEVWCNAPFGKHHIYILYNILYYIQQWMSKVKNNGCE